VWRSHICGNDCNNYLESFFNSMCEGVLLTKVIFDKEDNPIDYIFLEANSAFADITGLDKNDIIGKRASEVYPSIDPFWLKAFDQVASGGKNLEFEHYFKELDKYFKVSTFSPALGQFIVIFSDITKIKMANNFLKIHQILFDNAQDVILYIKKDGSIIDANKNAIVKYGYTHKELTTMNIQQIRHSSQAVTFGIEMAAADKGGVVFESLHLTKDGTNFPVEVSAKATLIDDEPIRIHIIRDITERKASEEKIKYLANYDSLTGIPNRSHLMSKLDLTIKQAKELGTRFALMLFDIDKFKKINDVYGHDAGDIVLMNTASRVQNSIGKLGFLGRLGGDEFVIIVPLKSGIDVVSNIANNILKELDTPIKLNNITLPVTISIGIAIFPEDSADKPNLMINADKAMYLSKQAGGNAYKFFSENP
jgi:diguanylate cyclase (GGDEF)-like protein/PAS domain S-box-containing protein